MDLGDGRANFLRDKLLGHAGLPRDAYTITRQPPTDGVVVPLGADALDLLCGRRDILDIRGYPLQQASRLIYPTIHPDYILQGNGNYGTVFIHDVQRAAELEYTGFQGPCNNYLLDPPVLLAQDWVTAYLAALAADPSIYLAYDIETPWTDEEKEAGSLEADDSDRAHILRISLSYAPHTAISVTWSGEYLPVIARALASPGAKVVWNDGFDSPRIRSWGMAINGPVYDGMVAWHVLNSDLPKSLRFVASMLLDDQPAWKHLSHDAPAFYNAVDADVELRLIHAIFARLHEAGLWGVYDRHILQLAPIFTRLSTRGMPIDRAKRAAAAQLLADRLTTTAAALEAAVPLPARKIAHTYTRTPKCLDGLLVQSELRPLPRCSVCAAAGPTKAHFKPTRKGNPCAAGTVQTQPEMVLVYHRLHPFKPSKEQLTTYCQHAHITPPTRRDPKTHLTRITFDENAIRHLLLKYPADPVFQKCLDYREIDKIAGTYIGRPAPQLGTAKEAL